MYKNGEVRLTFAIIILSAVGIDGIVQSWQIRQTKSSSLGYWSLLITDTTVGCIVNDIRVTRKHHNRHQPSWLSLNFTTFYKQLSNCCGNQRKELIPSNLYKIRLNFISSVNTWETNIRPVMIGAYTTIRISSRFLGKINRASCFRFLQCMMGVLNGCKSLLHQRDCVMTV